MIIAFNAYDERKKSDQIFVPVVHLTAAVMVRTSQFHCAVCLFFKIMCWLSVREMNLQFLVSLGQRLH